MILKLGLNKSVYSLKGLYSCKHSVVYCITQMSSLNFDHRAVQYTVDKLHWNLCLFLPADWSPWISSSWNGCTRRSTSSRWLPKQTPSPQRNANSSRSRSVVSTAAYHYSNSNPYLFLLWTWVWWQSCALRSTAKWRAASVLWLILQSSPSCRALCEWFSHKYWTYKRLCTMFGCVLLKRLYSNEI